MTETYFFHETLLVLLKIQKILLTVGISCVIINESLNESEKIIEAWLSLVERYIRDVEVASSNLVASIFFEKTFLCQKKSAEEK